MNQPEFPVILDDCIKRLRQGESLASCLADYPDQAAELTPMLELTTDLFTLPPLEASVAATQQGLEAMLAAWEEPPATAEPWAGFGVWFQQLLEPLQKRNPTAGMFVLRTAVAVLLLLVLGSGFAITAAAESLPGDLLYPVKRGWETTQLTLTRNEAARETLQTSLDERRRQEVRAVVESGRTVEVVFNGRVRTQSEDEWLIDNIAVQLVDTTLVEAGLALGNEVEVQAEAHGDGTLVAVAIMGVKRPLDAIPNPTATATADPTATPQPTATMRSTATPTMQATATTVATSLPTATEEPTETPEPTATRGNDLEATPTHPPDHEPTGTGENDQQPTATHPPAQPTATRESDHEPTATRESDHEPTATAVNDHEPTATRQDDHPPTATHKPTATHEPTPTRSDAHEATPTPESDHRPTATPANDHAPTPTPPRDGD